MSTVATSNRTQTQGRDLIRNLFVAIRSAQLYESGNETLQAATERLTGTVIEIHQVEGFAKIETGRNLALVNDQRVRVDLRSHGTQANLTRFLHEIGIGGFHWRVALDAAATNALIAVVGRMDPESVSSGLAGVQKAVANAGIRGIDILPVLDEVEEFIDDPDTRERAVRMYRHSVAVTRDLMSSLRSGQALRRPMVRRAVQSIVDQVMEDETLMVGLTTLRDFDEPTFTHAVNVCIFSISVGQRIGLSRVELYELGMAALLHDVGKVDVPLDVLNKAGALDTDEWEHMKRHTQHGVWRILADRSPGTLPTREMLVTFEHHLHMDLSGYPTLVEPRRQSFFTRIVEVCDAFDAGTTPRVYKTDPLSSAEMIEILDRGKGVRYDRVLVKAFISMLGIYPPGSTVLLDTFEIAIVMSNDPEPEHAHRPRIKIVADPDGNRVDGPHVSLTEQDEDGEYVRNVIKVINPERYGISVARHFLPE